MSTTYGTISTAAPPPEVPFLSRARQRVRSGIGVRRPWKEVVVSFSLPESFNTGLHRIQTNTSYFHVNYVIIVLFMLFISLLWHPISLIVFTATMFAWLFLYFLRNDPIILCGYGVEERLVLVVLSVSTVVLLLLTHAMVFLVGLTVGIAVVLAHAVFRRTNDLVFDEEEGGGWGGKAVVDLKETASASYSLSL